nr:uncharacterized protein LOC109185866 [Ipomoea trifida]
MAARKSFLFFGVPEMTPASGGPQFEFDESDVWSNNSNGVNDLVSSSDTTTRRSAIPSSRAAAAKKSSAVKARGVDRPASLPVNIPDWSKILGGEYKDRRRESEEEDEDEDGRVPPHVYLARTRVASLSVHEESTSDMFRGRKLKS